MNRWMKAFLIGVCIGIIVAYATGSQAAERQLSQREKPTDWAAWAPPGFTKTASPWTPLGANERGVFYLSTYVSPMLGLTFTLKQVSRGLSGQVTTLALDDFTVQCGPNGEPPDVVGSLGFVLIDARTEQVITQFRSPEFRGTETLPVPGSVLARAVITTCYGARR